MQKPELMDRLLRFIHYNTDQYIHHRERGEYSLAVQRLRRLRGLVNAAQQTAGPIEPVEWVKLRLIEKHVGAMLDSPQPEVVEVP